LKDLEERINRANVGHEQFATNRMTKS